MVKSLDIKRLELPLMAKNFPIRTFADDLADAIANPSPSRPFRNAVGEAGRNVCDALSNVPPWARTIPGAVRDLAGICAPYWDDEGIDPPVVAPPFNGGQCSGQFYRFKADEWNPITNQFVPDTIQGGALQGIVGPITSISLNVGSPCFTGFTGGRQLQIVVTSSFGGGQTLTFLPRCVADTNSGGVGLRNIQPFIDGGTPDNCGDPEPELKPGPNPSPRNPVIPPELQPIDDPETGPQLPIPDLPSLPGLPDIPFRNPFADQPSVDPIDPGTPGTPEDTGGGAGGAGGGDAEGDAPEGTELVGLKIDFSQPPVRGREYADGVFRAVAYVYMGGPQGLDQDLAGASIRSGQFVYAERRGLTRWRVAANIGFYLTVTPFYVERE